MRIPYGYQMENNAFIICQEKAEVVRMIFDYYLSGASLGKVADMFSENMNVQFEKDRRCNMTTKRPAPPRKATRYQSLVL